MFGMLGKAVKSKIMREKEDALPTVSEFTGVGALVQLVDSGNSNVSVLSGVVDELGLCDKEFTKTSTISFSGGTNTEEGIDGRDLVIAATTQDDTSDIRYFHKYPVGDGRRMIVSRDVSFAELLAVYDEDDFYELTSGEKIRSIKAKKSAIKKGRLSSWFSKKYRSRLYLPLTRIIDGSEMNVDYYLISNDAETKCIEIFVYEDSRTDVYAGFIYDVDDFIEKVTVVSESK